MPGMVLTLYHIAGLDLASPLSYFISTHLQTIHQLGQAILDWRLRSTLSSTFDDTVLVAFHGAGLRSCLQTPHSTIAYQHCTSP